MSDKYDRLVFASRAYVLGKRRTLREAGKRRSERLPIDDKRSGVNNPASTFLLLFRIIALVNVKTFDLGAWVCPSVLSLWRRGIGSIPAFRVRYSNRLLSFQPYGMLS